MTFDLIMLTTSLLVLLYAADKFIAGASSIARKFGISPLIIGLTIVAIGTSAPEMFVSTLAAINNKASIALGNAIGSNIANIGLILGSCALVHPLTVEKDLVKQDLPILLTLNIIISYTFFKFGLRYEVSLLLLVSFISYLLFLKHRAYKYRKDNIKDSTYSGKNNNIHHVEDELVNEVLKNNLSLTKARIYLIIGIVLLPISSHFLIGSASNIALSLGVSDLTISLTIVALGTSLPEFAASAVGVYRKEYSLAIGNIVGSNIFNLTIVLFPAALLDKQFLADEILTRDFPITISLTILLTIFVLRNKLSRASGLCLLAVYTYYIYLLI